MPALAASGKLLECGGPTPQAAALPFSPVSALRKHLFSAGEDGANACLSLH